MTPTAQQPQIEQNTEKTVYALREDPTALGMLAGCCVGTVLGYPVLGCGIGALAGYICQDCKVTQLQERPVSEVLAPVGQQLNR